MRLLLDTHILLWATLATEELGAGERGLMEEADEGLVVSAVSFWELRLKWNSLHPSGERKGPASPQLVEAVARRLAWRLLPITPAHAVAILREPVAHKDPFDELLLVQAQEEGCRLLTRDGKLAGHPLAVSG